MTRESAAQRLKIGAQKEERREQCLDTKTILVSLSLYIYIYEYISGTIYDKIHVKKKIKDACKCVGGDWPSTQAPSPMRVC